MEVPEEFEDVACPGCGGRRAGTALQGRNLTLNSDQVFRIVRCDDCGLCYTNPRPKVAALGTFYPREYAPYGGREKESGGIGQLVLREAFGSPPLRPRAGAKIMARMVAAVRSAESFGFGVPWRGQGRLLDFGCGGGKFLRRMNRLGWDVTGIDFNEDAVKAVRASGLKAVQGTLPHAQLKPASFDVVTMRHALEHVPAPREVLRAAWELVDGGGMLLVSVPNFNAWEVEAFGAAAVGLDLPRHLTHFERATLKKMMEDQGMKEVRVRQLARVSWIRKGAKRAGRRLLLGARVAAMLAERKGRGSEIIAVAEKTI